MNQCLFMICHSARREESMRPMPPNFQSRGFFAALKTTIIGVGLVLAMSARAEDGYRLWLRYDLIPDATLRQSYIAAISEIVLPEAPPGPGGFGAATIPAMRDELATGFHGLLGV